MDIKAIVALVALISAGIMGAESRYTPSPTFYRHVADSRTGTILDIVGRARGASGQYKDTLCSLLVQELNEVCSDSPAHPLCLDREMYLEQAGC